MSLLPDPWQPQASMTKVQSTIMRQITVTSIMWKKRCLKIIPASAGFDDFWNFPYLQELSGSCCSKTISNANTFTLKCKDLPNPMIVVKPVLNSISCEIKVCTTVSVTGSLILGLSFSQRILIFSNSQNDIKPIRNWFYTLTVWESVVSFSTRVTFLSTETLMAGALSISITFQVFATWPMATTNGL